MGKAKHVRAVLKAVELLQTINERDSLTAHQIARHAGIPRPTAYRLLETLEEAGLIVRGPSDDGWHLTRKVKSLSSGFRDELWIAQCAMPVMTALGRDLLWPLDLHTFENYAMVVRESTHAISPFSLDLGMVGRSVPMLLTAAGRAYLAFCPEKERTAILAAMAQYDGPEFELARRPAEMAEILEQVRATGLGFRANAFNPHTRSLSAPILVGERVLASLTIIWIASAVSFEDAYRDFAGPLKAASERIAAAFSEAYSGDAAGAQRAETINAA